MTKQQAIKKLVALGCKDVVPDGKFCVYLTTPSGHRALVDPRELLKELEIPKTPEAPSLATARFTAEHFDYEKQAWVGADGRYLCCAHPVSMNCQCYGRLHYGELAILSADQTSQSA